jgi:hypothetical protein
MSRVRRLAVMSAIAAALQAPIGDAQELSRQVVEQKEALVRRLLGDSPATKRIAASSNREAQALIEAAQRQHEKSMLLIKGNDLKGADGLLNDAMWTIGKARQLVPDPIERTIEQRVRYARMLEGVESLRASYQRNLARTNATRQGVSVEGDELVKVDALVADARNSAGSERLDAAIRALGQAEQILMHGLNKMLGKATLDYARRFETVAEEFDYELDQNRSYAELVPVAIAELGSSEGAIRLAGRYIDTNRTLVRQAQEQAAKKDYQDALKRLRQGTSYLQRALLAVGLVVPREADSE